MEPAASWQRENHPMFYACPGCGAGAGHPCPARTEVQPLFSLTHWYCDERVNVRDTATQEELSAKRALRKVDGR